MRGKNTPWVLESKNWVFLLVLLLTPSLAQAQDPPSSKQCLAYAFTSSEPHLFLIGDNTSVFGNEIQINHDCDDLQLFIDGEFAAASNSNLTYSIEPGRHNITMIFDNQTLTMENVDFYPDRLEWEYEWEQLEEQKSAFISISDSNFQINWAVAFSIVIVWVLAVYVYWQLINSYVERTFIEEVSQ